MAMRWMRAPENWKTSQKSAHAILTTDDMQTANSILKKGIIIEGSRLQARKLKDEPRRCFKCQKFGTKHTAASCRKSQTDAPPTSRRKPKSRADTPNTNIDTTSQMSHGHGSASQTPARQQRDGGATHMRTEDKTQLGKVV